MIWLIALKKSLVYDGLVRLRQDSTCCLRPDFWLFQAIRAPFFAAWFCRLLFLSDYTFYMAIWFQSLVVPEWVSSLVQNMFYVNDRLQKWLWRVWRLCVSCCCLLTISRLLLVVYCLLSAVFILVVLASRDLTNSTTLPWQHHLWILILPSQGENHCRTPSYLAASSTNLAMKIRCRSCLYQSELNWISGTRAYCENKLLDSFSITVRKEKSN